MSKGPLVSVVVPVYKVEKFLSNCLESILNQTYRNIEVICVNDGSPDRSESIIDEYSGSDIRVKKLNKINQGLNAARQSGAEASIGDFIMFVDSDDIIAEDCIEYLLERLLSSGVDISVGGYRYFSGGDDLPVSNVDTIETAIISRDNAVEWLLTGSLNESIYGNADILRMTAWAKLYRAHVINSTDWNLANYRANEDELEIIQWYGVAHKGVSVSTKPVYFYRTNPDSITRKKYSNINPEGDEITRFEFANDWREKVSLYLDDAKFTDKINQRFIWMIQNGVVKSIQENSFTDNMKDNVLRAVRGYQHSLLKENAIRESTLQDLQTSRSWRWTGLLRNIAQRDAVRVPLRVLRKALRALRYPRVTLSNIREKVDDRAARKKYKHTWVISDRPEEAADNGILFYDYLSDRHPEINAYYVISQSSPHYKELQKRGVKVIDYGSEEHRQLMTYAGVEASAFFNFAPFELGSLARRHPLVRVFILHGMDQSDLSQHYRRMGLDLYCVVTEESQNFYKAGKSIEDISSENIQISGMPRYDLMRQMLSDTGDYKSRNKIVIAPTWRRFLLYKPGTVERQPESYLKKSEYYYNYTKIFNSSILKKLSKKYEIILIPHPEMLSRIREFNIPNHIKIETYTNLGTRGLYSLALETRLFISDFSSTIFDFAFLGANVAHFNFDEGDYYSEKQEIYKSWFDIERDGFGPSFQSPTDLISYIAKENWTKREENIDKVWRQIPENSSELIYQNIQKLLKDDER